MAKMIPNNISSYNFTESEHMIYKLLKENLPKDYIVYYSITYHIPSNRGKYFYRGEVDFIILHPDYGLICMEVKGGKGLIYKDKKWKLILNEPSIPNNIKFEEFKNEFSNQIENEDDLKVITDSYEKDEINNEFILKKDINNEIIIKILKNYGLLTDIRILNKSPIKQSSDSADILKNYFKKVTNRDFSGRVGYCVCFPFFRVDKNLGIELADRNLIIDSYDLENIKPKIDKIFSIFNPNKMLDHQDFVSINKIINENRFYGITTAQEIKLSKKRLNEINRVQDFTLNLLSNYRKVKFRGGAGTGKTWIAMKKAVLSAKKGMKTLLTCFNSNLAIFMNEKCKEFLNNQYINESDINSIETNLEIKTFNYVIVKLLGKRFYDKYKSDIDKIKLPDIDKEAKLYITSDDVKYDTIVVDEAQDFSEEWQDVIENLLKSKDEGILYFFYDPYQNIFGKNFKNFLIAEPEYILTENLRNTKEIYNYAINIANNIILKNIDNETFQNEIINNIYNDEDLNLIKKSFIFNNDNDCYILDDKLSNKEKETIWRIFDRIGFKTIEPSELEGIEPNIVEVESEREGTKKLKAILKKLIKDNGILENQIIILSNRRLENSFIYKYQYMLNYQISFYEEKVNSNSIKFRTIQGFKGLESDVIIYLEHFSKKDDSRIQDKNPYLRYVAYTRAKFILEIISFDEKNN